MTLLFIILQCFVSFNSNEQTVFWNKTTHDFGKVGKNEELTTQFKCFNLDSNQVLNIENTIPSCGCIVSKPSKNVISYKDSATIDVVFKVGKKSIAHQKNIIVYTNKGFFELSLLAKVE
jgi:hypothetical protein